MTILLFGSHGNLGSVLKKTFVGKRDEVIEGDWRRVVSGEEVIPATTKTDAIINAAAYNNVDGAEQQEEQQLLTELNVTLPKRLAEMAVLRSVPLVHYSSDYVFDGKLGRPYREDDRPNPISTYGQSKFMGEQAAFSSGANVYICRSSKLFGPAGVASTTKPSFLSTMFRLAKERAEISVVDDEEGSPTYTLDIAEATFQLLHGDYAPGIYHFINEGPGLTWYNFVREAFAITRVATSCIPVPSSMFPRPAPRPHAAPLANTKFPPLRSRTEALQDFLTTGNI